MTDTLDPVSTVVAAQDRVRAHDFHPLDEEGSFTVDRALGEHGIADLCDPDGRVRLLAVRDLVLAGHPGVPAMMAGLSDPSEHVRQVSAAALGILRAEEAAGRLQQVAEADRSLTVRSQAVVALGQMVSRDALDLLGRLVQSDPSRFLRHRCELAIDRIGKDMGATDELREAYRRLDPKRFGQVGVGKAAPEFVLSDTEEHAWRLSDFRGQWVVLIWIFADWCPVCHGEFRELIEMREAFEQANVMVFTVECSELYRGRVMVGKELEPHYWFSERPFSEAYIEGIWWPHLLDHAGVVGAEYGVDPMAFAANAEYVNRPATILVDPSGIVRFMNYGTYWGDRPTIQHTLQMICTGEFEFEHTR